MLQWCQLITQCIGDIHSTAVFEFCYFVRNHCTEGWKAMLKLTSDLPLEPHQQKEIPPWRSMRHHITILSMGAPVIYQNLCHQSSCRHWTSFILLPRFSIDFGLNEVTTYFQFSSRVLLLLLLRKLLLARLFTGWKIKFWRWTSAKVQHWEI